MPIVVPEYKGVNTKPKITRQSNGVVCPRKHTTASLLPTLVSLPRRNIRDNNTSRETPRRCQSFQSWSTMPVKFTSLKHRVVIRCCFNRSSLLAAGNVNNEETLISMQSVIHPRNCHPPLLAAAWLVLVRRRFDLSSPSGTDDLEKRTFNQLCSQSFCLDVPRPVLRYSFILEWLVGWLAQKGARNVGLLTKIQKY